MTVRRFVVALVLAFAGAAVAGCSGAVVSGSPTTAAKSSAGGDNYGTAFNSCTDLTDGDVRSYGLDPSTKADTTSAIEGLGQGCGWGNNDTLVSFTVGRQTIADFKANKGFQVAKPVVIGGRDSVEIVLDDTGNCAIAIPTGSSAVVVGLSLKFDSLKTAGDPCVLATNIADKFVTMLPK